MTEDTEKIKEWKYDFAWRQLENAQKCNAELDTKAMNNINFSSIIIPIITGILLYILDKKIVINFFNILMGGSLLFLFISIFFAFAVLWLRDQGVIRTVNQFKAIDKCDFIHIVGGTSQDLADWQKKIVDAGDNKSKYLKVSGAAFVVALLLIFFGGVILLTHL